MSGSITYNFMEQNGTHNKYFIVSDVHSYYTEMMDALNFKGFDVNNNKHVLVVNGDLFDRGQESSELYTFVKGLGNRFIYIRGNHEDLLRDFCADVLSNRMINNHHFSNGTVDTAIQLCNTGYNDCSRYGYSESFKYKVKDTMLPILNWMDYKCKNYLNIGNKYIITHCWIPLMSDENSSFYSTKKLYTGIYDKWDCDPSTLSNSDYMLYRSMWHEARWGNPFECWKQGMTLDGKIIVSGHWHSSYGYSHIDMTHKEFPQKDRYNWKDSFRIWERDNFLAIDGCVPYSKTINCLVIEYDVEKGEFIHNV